MLFTGRAAMLHMGAFTATIMAANVAMIIIPNQKIVVADLKAGRVPDAKYGKIAKQRSLHNNYLTLPVIFFMLSNHYPLAFATQWNWIIASLIFLDGRADPALFQHAPCAQGQPALDLAAAVVIFIVITWLSTAPKLGDAARRWRRRAPQPFLAAAHFPAVRDVIMGRCSMCHSAEPAMRACYEAPKNVILDNDAAIANHAERDRHAGRLQPRHAAGQRHRDHRPRSGRCSSPGSERRAANEHDRRRDGSARPRADLRR